ncbi:KIN17 KIN ANTIGENIC DETERMINANT OF RECA PROTEIN-like protein [Salix koriyanagi]|uniref:KIN17 KIN ANTIGENIC DETERMINANT OF RECA PROTEIN-like protein n=1 Tax=Salix koriyanagi TaxID=2511006 RepID=A0A9Q1AIJ3_9ROSI|nr:KIN17 KIN ANTIGENIC DETERMINANT OF RECA PROTEIN-like protein [Salix koriyanagi]
MGKNDFLTPKAIANRIIAKGLQKLRWYCQMCQKQCRDENGFQFHSMSESHQRQMQVLGQNPNRIIDGYSEEFENEFLDMMKRSHRFSRVAATVVYNEYIHDRHHIHMNSTQWATLTEFDKYLGRTGKCKVEETPKGWFITYFVLFYGYVILLSLLYLFEEVPCEVSVFLLSLNFAANCLKIKFCSFCTVLHEFGLFHLIFKMEVTVVSSCGRN